MPGCCNRILQSMGNRLKKTHTHPHLPMPFIFQLGLTGFLVGVTTDLLYANSERSIHFPSPKREACSLWEPTHTKTPLPSLPSPLPVAIQPQLSTLPNPLQPYTVTKQLSLKLTTRPSLTSIHTNAKGTRSKHSQRSGQPGPAPPAHWDLWNIKKELNLHSFS